MKKIIIMVLAVLFLSMPVYAQDDEGHASISYKADQNNGTVKFAGKHAGQDFTGQFGEWSALVNFVPANPSASKITAILVTSTAKTGNAMYDGTLPQADWFDSKTHVQATFHATTIHVVDAEKGQYATDGELTIKGITKPVGFDFTMSDPTVEPVLVKAQIPVNRLDFEIGEKSDPSAEWVDETITITLDFKAVYAE